MDNDCDEMEKNGWDQYGRLVLNELKRLNDQQTDLKTDLDKKFFEMMEKHSDLKQMERDVDELSKWRENVTDVWSTSQMKQSKDEIYQQKNMWSKTMGIAVVVQIIIAFIITMASKFLK